jgi:hypothetical protein
MKKILLSTLAMFASFNLLAADYTGITSAVNFADAITAIIAIAGTIAGVLVVIKGWKLISPMISSKG